MLLVPSYNALDDAIKGFPFPSASAKGAIISEDSAVLILIDWPF
jgi:hypothetical protein